MNVGEFLFGVVAIVLLVAMFLSLGGCQMVRVSPDDCSVTVRFMHVNVDCFRAPATND